MKDDHKQGELNLYVHCVYIYIYSIFLYMVHMQNQIVLILFSGICIKVAQVA